MRTLNWRWMGRQLEGVALWLVVLYAVGVGGTLNGLVELSLRQLTLGFMVVLGGLLLVRARRRDSLPRFVSPLMGLCVATAVTTLFSADPRRSLIYLGYFCALTVAYWAVADWAAGQERRLGVAVYATLGLLVALSLHEIRLSVVRHGWETVAAIFRPSSLMGSSNIYATVLVIAGPLVALRILTAASWLRRGLWALGLLLLAALLVMVNSRAAWVAAAVGAGVFVLLAGVAYGLLAPATLLARLKRLPRWGQVALAGVAIGLLAAFVAALPLITFRATDMTQHGAIYKRLDIWEAAIAQFGQTPLFGRGPFTYGDAYLERVSTPPETPHAHAHSLVLNFAAEEGVLGLGILLWLAWTALVAVRRGFGSALPVAERLNGAAAAALLSAVVVNNLFDLTLVPGVALLVLWALTYLLPGAESSVGLPALRRWGAPLLWVAALALWAFPLPALQAADGAVDAASQGRWDVAAENYEVAVQRAPAMTIYRFDAAYVYAQLALGGDDVALSRAIELYGEALTVRPEFALNWANLAILEYRAGRTDAALADIRTAARRAPDAPVFAELAGIMAGGGDVLDGEMPSVAGFGEGDTYSVHGWHVPGPGVFLLPLPDAGATL